MLRTAQVKAIASRRRACAGWCCPVDPQMTIDAHYDLRQQPEGVWDSIGLRLEQIGDAIAVFFAPDDRTIRVVGSIGAIRRRRRDRHAGGAVEGAPCVRYGLNISRLSIVISLITAALVYFAISALLVRPMMRISRAMLRFSEDPEDPQPHHRPVRAVTTRSASPSAS